MIKIDNETRMEFRMGCDLSIREVALAFCSIINIFSHAGNGNIRKCYGSRSGNVYCFEALVLARPAVAWLTLLFLFLGLPSAYLFREVSFSFFGIAFSRFG